MLNFDFLSDKYSDDIKAFQFNDTPDEISVGDFLKEKALNLHRCQSAITRLYFDEDQNLVGFFTLHNDQIRISPRQLEEFEKIYGWKLPIEDHHSYPGIKLHYLGVDKRYRGLGYGKHLLRDVNDIASEIGELSGCNFVSVEALTTSIDFYHKRGFVWLAQNEQFANMIFKLGEIEIDESMRKMIIDPMTLGKMIESLVSRRKELGWDHSYLAQAAGVQEEIIESLEFSSQVPDVETIKLLAEALEIPYNRLF
ncbi:GNAT family N-acetyltransferase [Paenibacillus sp. FSL H3-0333]|uniref:GNAT family N-acetyltransferase n=1 Tax=Paenibacillus sp. FSL H3-0333 TaxID=2921373 RepID=UPI0030F6B72C